MKDTGAIARIDQHTPPSPEVLATVLLGGDIAKLSPMQKISYYFAVCKSLGLNPLTRPFDFLWLDKKLLLYAKKDCADQLRRKYHVALSKPRAELIDGMFQVSIDASLPNGRTDADIGVVDLSGLAGVQKANGMMKAFTKAKRRVTLSICGLGMLEESELDATDSAIPLDFDPESGNMILPPAVDPGDGELESPPDDTPPAKPSKPPRPISSSQCKRLWTVARKHGWNDVTMRRLLEAKPYGLASSRDILTSDYDAIIETVSHPPPAAPVEPPPVDEIFGADKPPKTRKAARTREPGEEG